MPPYPHPDWSDALVVEGIQAKLAEWASIPRQLEAPLAQLLNDMMKDGFIAGLRRNEAAFKAWADLLVRLPYDDQFRFLTQKNPKANWDHYDIGGRWTGYFRLRPGCCGFAGNGRISEPGGRADICCFGDIDLRGMATQALRQARSTWRETLRPMHGFARQFQYHVAPDMDRREYLAQMKKAAILPQAFLHDGQWHEQGRMHMVSAAQNAKTLADWIEEFHDLFYSLPADTPVSVIDCHRCGR